ncbi:MAG: hypothetical protein OSJ46_07010 [Duncaniella sp.]|nr:hypothetical protein [Duncaniella sp.]
MTNCLHKGVKRLVFSVFAIMVAGCLYAVTKTATFDFTNPNSLSIEDLAIESGTISISNKEFVDGAISLKFGGPGNESFIRIYGGDKYCVKFWNGNTLAIAIKQSDASVKIGTTQIYAASTTKFSLSDFKFNTGMSFSTHDDGSWGVISGESVSDGWYITCATSSLFIGKIEVEYEIEEPEQPEVPEIKDMPSNLTKTDFSDFDGNVSEQTDYVITAGDVVATGNLLENGHLEVVRFMDGVKAFPVDYAFRFKELFDGEYVIQNKRNEYLSAGENGHFALTDLDEEALLWNVFVDGGKVIIAESSMSRAGGKSILFSESTGGFGRYNAGGDAIAPTVYAYTSPTTAIADLVENDEAEAVYYDLRGNVLDRDMLLPGIYICRKGLEVTKVVIK